MELIKQKQDNKRQEQKSSSQQAYIKKQQDKKPATPVYKEYVGVSSPSLKNILSDSQERKLENSEQTNIVAEQNKKFATEDLNLAWSEFVQLFEQESPRFYPLFKGQTPLLTDDYVLQIRVDNISQKKEIQERILNNMLKFLKEKLKNDKLKIEFKISHLEQKNMIYTDIEKYNYLKEKNKNLDLLREVFNLDFY